MQPDRVSGRIKGEMISNFPRPGLSLALGVVLAFLIAGCKPEGVTSAPFIYGEKPADRAAAFLVSNEAVLDSDAIYPLVYLRRRFGAHWAEGAIVRLAQESREPQNKERLYPFLRLLDPGARYSFDPAAPSPVFAAAPTAWNLVLALHCRETPLTPAFLKSIEEQAGRWDRAAALGARAIGWAADQGCFESFDIKATDALLKQKMLDYVHSREAVDIGYVEAVSMLLYRGHRSSLNPAWIEKIEAAQGPDGSWSLPDTAADRSTSECLLALEQFANPDAPRVSWVP